MEFSFYSNFKRTISKQTVENLIRRSVASDLVLHCLPMSHKKVLSHYCSIEYCTTKRKILQKITSQ